MTFRYVPSRGPLSVTEVRSRRAEYGLGNPSSLEGRALLGIEQAVVVLDDKPPQHSARQRTCGRAEPRNGVSLGPFIHSADVHDDLARGVDPSASSSFAWYTSSSTAARTNGIRLLLIR